MAGEITAATNIIEFTGDWTSAHLIALIRKRADDSVDLPVTAPVQGGCLYGVSPHHPMSSMAGGYL